MRVKGWILAGIMLLMLCAHAAQSGVAASSGSPNLFPEPAPSPGQVDAAKAEEIPLTLDDCIRRAISVGTSVLKAEYNTQYTGAQLLQAYGQFLPTLSSSGSYGYSTGTTYSTAGNPTYVTGSGTNAAYTIRTDLNIFNGLADYASLTSAILKTTASRLTVLRAKQQIKLDIIQSFYQVVLDHRLVDIAASNFRVSQEREKLFAGQVDVGQRHLSDLLRQRAQSSAEELQLLSSRNTMLKDQLALLRKLRLDVGKGYRFLEPKLIDEYDENVPKDERSLMETALIRRPDLKASMAIADADRRDVHAAEGAYFPKVDLIASLSSGAHFLDSQTVNGGGAVPVIQNNIGYQLGNQLQYSVSMALTWAIFDRFLTHQAVTRLQVVANSAQLDLQDLKNQVESDVRVAYGDYVTVLQQLRTSARGLDAAAKAYEVLEGRYTVGGINLLDLLTGQKCPSAGPIRSGASTRRLSASK